MRFINDSSNLLFMGLKEEILSDVEYTIISLMRKYGIEINQAVRKEENVRLFFYGEEIEVDVEMKVKKIRH